MPQNTLTEHIPGFEYRATAVPHAKALNTPIINQGLVRFLNPSPTATVADHDIFTDQVIAAICAEGTAFFTGTTFQGQRAIETPYATPKIPTHESLTRFPVPLRLKPQVLAGEVQIPGRGSDRYLAAVFFPFASHILSASSALVCHPSPVARRVLQPRRETGG
jgi:hypothetical protein